MKPALTLGVLGGMGAAATLEFLGRLRAYAPTKDERDHIRVIADINPKLPDLNAPGLGAGPALAEAAGALRGAGADVLAIVNDAAHVHRELIERASGLPVIDMIAAAAQAARETGAMRVGVLGPRGALRLYREYLAAQAMGLVSLDSERQQAFVAALEQVKAGDHSAASRTAMAGFVRDLIDAGAEAVIAGAVEIPFVLAAKDLKAPLIEPADLLARRCLAVCLGFEAAPTVAG